MLVALLSLSNKASQDAPVEQESILSMKRERTGLTVIFTPSDDHLQSVSTHYKHTNNHAACVLYCFYKQCSCILLLCADILGVRQARKRGVNNMEISYTVYTSTHYTMG